MAEDVPGLALHRVGLPLDDLGEGRLGGRHLPLRPVLDLRQRQDQVPRLVAVFVDLAPLHGLRAPGLDAAAELLHWLQALGGLADLGVALMAAALLQGLDQGVHLALGLLILQREEHPGLEVDQVGGHGDELAGDLQVHLPPLLQPGHILVADQGHGDVLDLHLILAEKEEDQVQGTLEVPHLLRPGADHLFQFIDRVLQMASPQ